MPASATAKGRVLLDARPLQGADTLRGLGTYVRGLLVGLVEEGFDRRLAVLVDARAPVPPLPGGDLVAFSIRPRYRGRLGLVEEAATLGAKLARMAPDLYHSPSLALPGRSPVPLVVTLHDLIPWTLGGPALRGERLRWWLGRRLLRRADVVIAVSRHTAEDAARIGGVDPALTVVIPEAPARVFQPREGAVERVAAKHGIHPPYLFYNGALDRRKDPQGLLQAWATVRALGREVPLVIAGAEGSQAPASMGEAVRLGHVPIEDLADLYSAAACLVFPSRYEGFGLPPLEAMACGCPVVAYRNSSLPGVLGDAATLVPDGDARALGEAAATVLGDAKVASRLRRAGLERSRRFSWRRTARETIRVYERLLGRA